MAAFEYTALDARGKRQRGILEGDSGRQIRQMLRDQGLAPLSVVASSARTRPGAGVAGRLGDLRSRLGSGMSALDLALFTRQLATLVGAGLPVEEALAALAQQASRRRIGALVMNVRSRVLEGHSLAAGLAQYPTTFSSMYRSTVAAGEQSGYLDAVLDNLARYTEKRFESVRNVQMALFYPALLVVISLLIVAGLLVYVVPDIVAVFENTGSELPLLTSLLIAASDFARTHYWAVALVLVGTVVVTRQVLARPAARLAWDRRKLGLPIVGRIVRGGTASRFANTLAVLTSSGVPLVDAMSIATEVVENEWLKGRLGEATQRVREGGSLRAGLEACGYFPPMFLHMVASGEASGELDAMLAKVAEHQQQELERLVTALVQVFQPLMLLVMAALVLLIVLAVLVPILNMNQLVV